MTKCSEMTAAMFEEIKEKMALMEEKIEDITFEQQQIGAIIQKDIEQRKTKTINVEKIVNYLLDSIRGIVNASMDNMLEENSKVYNKQNRQVEINKALLVELKLEQKKCRKLIIKKNGFQVLAAISILFNIYFINEIRVLKDSGLQLKYLQATKNVNDDVVSKLDTIFRVNRDEEVIKEIIKVVRDYSN